MEESLSLLKILFYSNNKVIKKLLSKASDVLVLGIAELALNILHNENLNVSEEDKVKLKKHHKSLVILANRSETLARKRHLVKTKVYKFLPLLLQVTLPYVTRNGFGSSGGVETSERDLQDVNNSSRSFRLKSNHHRNPRRKSKRTKPGK